MQLKTWGISIVLILIISSSTSLLIPKQMSNITSLNSADTIDYEMTTQGSRSIGELYTATFPAGSIIIPMDDKQNDVLKAFGFIHALLRNGTTIYRIIQPPDITIKTSEHANGQVYHGGPILIFPTSESAVTTVHKAFQNVTVDKIIESFYSSRVYAVTEPTNILVIFGGAGNTDSLLVDMEIPYTMINRSEAENNTELIGDPYTLVVVDCVGWVGYIPNAVAKAIRSLVEGGGEAMFNCYATQDMIAIFPDYVKGNLTHYHSEYCTFHPIAEFPAQYHGPHEMVFTNVYAELNGIHPDVRSVLTTNGTINNDAAIYFPYGKNNGVVVGTIFEPGNQPYGFSSRTFASTFYGNKFVHSPLPVEPPEDIDPWPIPNAGGPYIGYEGSEIVFNGSGSKDLNNDVLEYRWDFDGDGFWDTNWSHEPNATYTFGDDWFGMAMLNVREINTTKNYTTLDRAFVTVKNAAPVINTMQNFTINENKSITLYANTFDPGSDDLSFEWFWGRSYLNNNYSTYLNSPPALDPYPSLTINPRNVNDTVTNNLVENGVYRVTVTVTDDDGGVSFKNIFITVDIPPPEIIIIEPPIATEPSNLPPEAILSGNPLTGEVALSVNLNGFGIDFDGMIVSYVWDFGDGQTYSNLVLFPNNTLNSNFFHRYKEPGSYRVEFSVMDDSGARANDSLTIIVHPSLEGEEMFTISGYVYKASTNQRIAQVQILSYNISLLSDYSGYYSVKVPSGTYMLNVSKNGYESASATISVSSDTNLDFYLRSFEETPKDAKSTLDTFWDWSWVLVFIIIITILFFVGIAKRKKSGKKVQQPAPAPESVKSKANSPHISGLIVVPKSNIKQPSSAASTSASTPASVSSSAKPYLPKPQTPVKPGTTPTIVENNNSK